MRIRHVKPYATLRNRSSGLIGAPKDPAGVWGSMLHWFLLGTIEPPESVPYDCMQKSPARLQYGIMLIFYSNIKLRK